MGWHENRARSSLQVSWDWFGNSLNVCQCEQLSRHPQRTDLPWVARLPPYACKRSLHSQTLSMMLGCPRRPDRAFLYVPLIVSRYRSEWIVQQRLPLQWSSPYEREPSKASARLCGLSRCRAGHRLCSFWSTYAVYSWVACVVWWAALVIGASCRLCGRVGPAGFHQGCIWSSVLVTLGWACTLCRCA